MISEHTHPHTHIELNLNLEICFKSRIMNSSRNWNRKFTKNKNKSNFQSLNGWSDDRRSVKQIFGPRLHTIIHGHQRHILLIKKKGKYIF